MYVVVVIAITYGIQTTIAAMKEYRLEGGDRGELTHQMDFALLVAVLALACVPAMVRTAWSMGGALRVGSIGAPAVGVAVGLWYWTRIDPWVGRIEAGDWATRPPEWENFHTGIQVYRIFPLSFLAALLLGRQAMQWWRNTEARPLDRRLLGYSMNATSGVAALVGTTLLGLYWY